jgi:hypothetical protein
MTVSRGEMSIEPSTPCSASMLCGAAWFILPLSSFAGIAQAAFRRGRIALDPANQMTLTQPSLSAYGLASRQGLFFAEGAEISNASTVSFV